jgi:hypothetical protein
MEKFFSDESFLSNDEEGEYFIKENNLQIEPEENDMPNTELLRTQLIKLSCEWYEELMNLLNEELRSQDIEFCLIDEADFRMKPFKTIYFRLKSTQDELDAANSDSLKEITQNINPK